MYTPKWISTTYTLLELRDLGLIAGHPQALRACRLLLDRGVCKDGGIGFGWGRSETCVSGMVLSMCARFRLKDSRLDGLAGRLLEEQLGDGGWNCRAYRGSRHGSFHTTISVLEGLRDYEKLGGSLAREACAAQGRGREFFLNHRLYRSHRTGEVANPVFTRFVFPPRWHFDVLRGLDYFRECGADRDERLADAIGVVIRRRRPDGRWSVASHYRARVHFEMERAGEPSRWNTLRALRVLGWWKAGRSESAHATGGARRLRESR